MRCGFLPPLLSACSGPTPPDDTGCFCVAPCPSVDLQWTMKLWDSLATCLILLSSVHVSPLPRSRQLFTSARSSSRVGESPLELPSLEVQLPVPSLGISRAQAGVEDREQPLAGGEKCKTLWSVWGAKSAKISPMINLTSAGFLSKQIPRLLMYQMESISRSWGIK